MNNRMAMNRWRYIFFSLFFFLFCVLRICFGSVHSTHTNTHDPMAYNSILLFKFGVRFSFSCDALISCVLWVCLFVYMCKSHIINTFIKRLSQLLKVWMQNGKELAIHIRMWLRKGIRGVVNDRDVKSVISENIPNIQMLFALFVQGEQTFHFVSFDLIFCCIQSRFFYVLAINFSLRFSRLAHSESSCTTNNKQQNNTFFCLLFR